MTDLELTAVRQMTNGDLDALADLLSTEKPDLHPLVQRALYRLIRGSVEQTDFLIVKQQHPDLKDMRNGVRAMLSKDEEGITTAKLMAEYGAFKQGNYDSALQSTMKNTGFGKTKVSNYWMNHKSFIAYCVRLGHMTLPDDLKPR